MRLLALDQASNITGWSVWDGATLEDHGKFSVTEPNLGKRLYIIQQNILNLIDDFHIDEVAFEDIQLQKGPVNNIHTYRVLAEVIGALEVLFTQYEISYQIVSSNTWKSALGIKGKNRAEQKHNAQQWVINTYNKKPTQDECDAICLGACVIQSNKNDWS